MNRFFVDTTKARRPRREAYANEASAAKQGRDALTEVGRAEHRRCAADKQPPQKSNYTRQYNLFDERFVDVVDKNGITLTIEPL